MRAYYITAWFFAGSMVAQAQQGPDFDLPVQCGVEPPCFLQNLMDMDSGPGLRDPFCNAATYNGHKGTDIRLRNFCELRSNGRVYAMADGVVTALRNNMADRLMETARDKARIRGRECGNGLAIDYGRINGARYTSQLCHLARGSIKLRVGDRVKRGQQIGRIGLSGATEFPHLHFSINRNGQLIDPITGSFSDQACSDGSFKNTLFSAAALKPLTETGFQLLLEDGFADGPVNGKKILKSQIRRPGANTPFVYFAKFINLKKGDYLRMSIEGPGGLLARRDSKPLDRNKASYTAFLGKRNAPASGAYRGHVKLVRGGKVISTHTSKPFQF